MQSAEAQQYKSDHCKGTPVFDQYRCGDRALDPVWRLQEHLECNQIGSWDASESPCFQIVAINGRGFGAIAIRDIACGELVISETPVFAYEGLFTDKLYDTFDALPAWKQQAAMSLHDSCMLDGQKTLKGILTTNAICRGDQVGLGSCVLCEIVSRFNHSCTPNVEQSWNEDTFKMDIYASIDVHAGKELCLFYVDPRLPRLDRANALSSSYHFKCSCPACSPATVDESDDRRMQMKQLEDIIRHGGPTLGIPSVTELLQLYDLEDIHLHSLRGQACFWAFQLCLSSGRMPEAKAWMEKTYGHRKLCHGPHHAATLRAQAYLLNPESHPAFEAWRKRNQQSTS